MNRTRASRAAIVLISGMTFLSLMGSRCGAPIFGGGPPVVVDTVFVELVNTTEFPVNPNLIIDGVLQVVDPPLAPGDILPLEVDCFAGTVLETQADFLTGLGAVPSDNDPFVEEGFEFLCGDTVSFLFAEDELGFFTAVEVNGVAIATP